MEGKLWSFSESLVAAALERQDSQSSDPRHDLPMIPRSPGSVSDCPYKRFKHLHMPYMLWTARASWALHLEGLCSSQLCNSCHLHRTQLRSGKADRKDRVPGTPGTVLTAMYFSPSASVLSSTLGPRGQSHVDWTLQSPYRFKLSNVKLAVCPAKAVQEHRNLSSTRRRCGV